MRFMFAAGLTGTLMMLPQSPSPQTVAKPAPPPAGTLLQAIAWPAAESRLQADRVVLLPIGAAAQEHGPHLRLGTDAVLVEKIAARVAAAADVVVAPPLSYHYFPAFAEYPGSTSLAAATARDMTADIARSLARHGARRFLALTIGSSTVPALAESAKLLAAEGVLLRYSDARGRLDATARRLQRQVIGNHGDELETSMMLHLDPAGVDMALAVRDYGAPSTPFRLTRRPGNPGTLSPTGVWGDATLATAEKGRELVDALVAAVRADIEETRRAPLPVSTQPLTTPDAAPRRIDGAPSRTGRPDECAPGDDRAIRGLGPAFYAAWANLDPIRLAGFWAESGDMVHPDGFIEGSASIIRQNRAVLFGRPEYRNSRHALTIGQVRCIAADVAIADAKWELTGVVDAKGQPVPPAEGLCTLVLRRSERGWLIEAYRYNINPQAARPTLLQRPGPPAPPS